MAFLRVFLMSAEGYRCFFSVCVVSACVRGVLLRRRFRLVMIRAATGGVFRAFAVVSGSFEAFLMRVFRSLSRAAALLLACSMCMVRPG